MFSQDAKETFAILKGVLDDLSVCIQPSGVNGIDARTAIGDLRLHAPSLLANDAIGPALQSCFDLVVASGTTRAQMDWVRSEVSNITAPKTVGGAMMQNSCINLCLAAEADIIAAMDFESYQDVQVVLDSLTGPFQDAIELAADEMDQMTFQALTGLAGALTNYLVTTARPLPRLTNYQFASVLPSLVISYRLYSDASRADEIRQENKIVHPAFCPLAGLALSA